MRTKQFSKNHMQIPWHNFSTDSKTPAIHSTLRDKALLVGRIGILLLSCGTTSWRVRKGMAAAARALQVSCIAEIGIITINYTCFSDDDSITQAL